MKEIAATLDVSKSSASLWVRHVELSPEARARLGRRIRLGPVVAAELKAARARAVRLNYQREGRERALAGDATYMAGCMLYWAEGSKTRNCVQLCNSDPDLVVAFATFLREHFGVKGEQMSERLLQVQPEKA